MLSKEASGKIIGKTLLIDDIRTFPADLIARTYDDAIDAIMNDGPWSTVLIDHDLGDYTNLDHEKTGYDIMLFLENNPQYLPEEITCISANPAGRERINSVISRLYENPAKNYLVHSTAIIDDNVEIGQGTKVWQFTHVSSGARVGKNCSLGQGVYIGSNVTIGDGCRLQNHVNIFDGVTLGDNVFMGPCSCTTNDPWPRITKPIPRSQYAKTIIGNNASICAGAVLVSRPGKILEIGEWAMVGAGSVVTNSVPEKAVVFGNPARIVRYIKEGE